MPRPICTHCVDVEVTVVEVVTGDNGGMAHHLRPRVLNTGGNRSVYRGNR
jgi:hypothetical protein